MNIFVLVKQVPDTETKIKVSGSGIDDSDIKWIVSPFDEHAIEEALKIKTATGGTVTAVSLGNDRVIEALRAALAMGADKAVHLKDDNYNVLDVGYAASVLGSYLKGASADLILTGHIAIDSQSSMTPSMIAAHLECANINNAVEVTVNGSHIKVKREVEGGTAIMETDTPVVISAAKKLNEPRYPSLKGKMAAKKIKPEVVDVASLNVQTAKVEIVSIELPPPRPPGRIIEGETAQERAATLVKLLREEAKVI